MIGTLKLNYPMFRDQVEPKGRLVIDKKCHACWYYFMLAYSNWERVGKGPEDQIIVEESGLSTPKWMDQQFHNIAKTVALIYGLDSPEDFLPYFPLIEKEAKRIGPEGFEIPFAIVRPFGVGMVS